MIEGIVSFFTNSEAAIRLGVRDLHFCGIVVIKSF